MLGRPRIDELAVEQSDEAGDASSRLRGNGGVVAAASCSPSGEHRRRSLYCVLGRQGRRGGTAE